MPSFHIPTELTRACPLGLVCQCWVCWEPWQLQTIHRSGVNSQNHKPPHTLPQTHTVTLVMCRIIRLCAI